MIILTHRRKCLVNLRLIETLEREMIKIKDIKLVLVVVTISCFSLVGCQVNSSSIKGINIMYPAGEEYLTIGSDGNATMGYGAGVNIRTIQKNTFDIELIYKQIKPSLVPNDITTDKFPPHSNYGHVGIYFNDNSEKDYLIFNEDSFAKKLFYKAKKNVVE